MFLTQRRAYFSFVIYTWQAKKENFTVKMLFKKNTDSVVMAMCAFTSVSCLDTFDHSCFKIVETLYCRKPIIYCMN